MRSLLATLRMWWGYMSSAVFTALTIVTLVWNPTSKTQLWIYGSLAIVLMIGAEGQTIFQQYRKIRKLEATPPEIDLKVEDVILSRSSEGESRWQNGEFFLRCSALLNNRKEEKVKYAAQLVFRGEEMNLNLLEDLDSWMIRDRDIDRHYSRDTLAVTPKPLANSLEIQHKHEGWLHFQVKNFSEHQVQQTTLRLYVIGEHGKAHCDVSLKNHLPYHSDLVPQRRTSRRGSDETAI
jgi:hypothetical protein